MCTQDHIINFLLGDAAVRLSYILVLEYYDTKIVSKMKYELGRYEVEVIQRFLVRIIFLRKRRLPFSARPVVLGESSKQFHHAKVRYRLISIST